MLRRDCAYVQTPLADPEGVAGGPDPPRWLENYKKAIGYFKKTGMDSV